MIGTGGAFETSLVTGPLPRHTDGQLKGFDAVKSPSLGPNIQRPILHLSLLLEHCVSHQCNHRRMSEPLCPRWEAVGGEHVGENTKMWGKKGSSTVWEALCGPFMSDAGNRLSAASHEHVREGVRRSCTADRDRMCAPAQQPALSLPPAGAEDVFDSGRKHDDKFSTRSAHTPRLQTWIGSGACRGSAGSLPQWPTVFQCFWGTQCTTHTRGCGPCCS